MLPRRPRHCIEPLPSRTFVIYFTNKGGIPVHKSFALSLALIFILSVSPEILWASEKSVDIQKTTWGDLFSDVFGHYPLPANTVSDNDSGQKGKLNIPKNWEFDFGLQRFLASHTSYEIGNDDPPNQKPLSRLKFPMNTWWMNFDVRRTCPRWSIGSRAGFSISNRSDGWMQDWDWKSVDTSNVVSDYGKGYCRVTGSFLFREDVDVNISDWLGLPSWAEIRPLFAFQFQRLSFLDHDGEQYEYFPYNNYALEGDSIRFRQDWYLYMIGLRESCDLAKLNKYLTIKARGEADWGPALGYNQDHHLRRPDLWGYINSMGNALYFSAGLDMVVSKTITVGVTVDYTWIRTSGEEHQYNDVKSEDLRWTDYVHSYSDQLSLIAHVSYAF